VVICSRTYEDVASVAAELNTDHDGRVVPVECDVTDSESVRYLVDTAVDEFGDLRVLVNNAGDPLSQQTCSTDVMRRTLSGCSN